MDQDTIQKIAQEIVRQLPNYSWQFVVVQAVAMLAALAGGIFIGMHLRTRVTKTDVGDLRDQIRGDTKSSETVKAEIEQENWRTREWANLRRIKLEALLNRMHDCEPYLDRLRQRPAKATSAEERDPLSELEIITTLYFPELKVEVDDYLGRCRAQKSTILEARSEAKKSEAPLQPIENTGSDMNGTEFEAVRERLNVAARNLTVQIMGVEEQNAGGAGRDPAAA